MHRIYKKHLELYNIIIGLLIFFYAAYMLPLNQFTDLEIQVTLMVLSFVLVILNTIVLMSHFINYK